MNAQGKNKPTNELEVKLCQMQAELQGHARHVESIRTFASRIDASSPEQTYTSILEHAIELVRAGRGSLQIYDEASNELVTKAAAGPGTDLSQAGCAEHKSFVSYPIVLGKRTIGALNVADKIGAADFDEADLSLIDSIASHMALALDGARWQEKARQFELMSITDSLTGLLNRRYLEQRLAEELSQSQRHNYPMSFLMIDIDDFKRYNDRHGHQTGDRALEITAACLKSELRKADVASRYGGEEFCVLLPQTTCPQGFAIAERIRRKIESTVYPRGSGQAPCALTVSIGLSSFSKTLGTPEAIMQAADSALYQAKSQGKNCTCACQDLQAAV